ncbi:MAG TPA: energy transducer TonB [Bacteroidales bacterium]|nr:energy transducer TonB [Bacteroidales bacterium]
MAKNIDLTSQKWIDLIFEGRNKSYGAYVLRQQSAKRHTLAFIAVMTFTLLLMAVSMGISKYNRAREATRMQNTEKVRLIDVDLQTPDEPEEIVKEHVVYIPPEELVKSIKFTVPEITKDELVTEENQVKGQDELLKDPLAVISIIDNEKGRTDGLGINPEDLKVHKTIVAQVEEPEKVFEIVEQQPGFPGGNAEMYKWLSQNIVYPVIAQENQISGRVTLRFVVEKDGSIAEIEVIRGVHESLNKEAIRVVKTMPKWIPGKQGGIPVKVRLTLPITFELK